MSKVKEIATKVGDTMREAIEHAYQEGAMDERRRILGTIEGFKSEPSRTVAAPALKPKARFSLRGEVPPPKLTHFQQNTPGARKRRRNGSREEAAAIIQSKARPGQVFRTSDIIKWVRPMSGATGTRGAEDLAQRGVLKRLERGVFQMAGQSSHGGVVAAASQPGE